jgi:hypothetical protein
MLRLYLVVAMRNSIHWCIFAISGLLRRVSFKFPDIITRIGRTGHTLPIMQDGPPTDDLSHHRDNSSSVCSAFAENPTLTKELASEDGKSSRPAIARQRFKGAVRSVIVMQQQHAARPLMPQRIPSFDWNSAVGMSPTRPSSVDLEAAQGPRATLIPKLKTLEPVQDLSVHTALVRHLQFSPSGKYLATSRCVVTSSSELLVLR